MHTSIGLNDDDKTALIECKPTALPKAMNTYDLLANLLHIKAESESNKDVAQDFFDYFSSFYLEGDVPLLVFCLIRMFNVKFPGFADDSHITPPIKATAKQGKK